MTPKSSINSLDQGASQSAPRPLMGLRFNRLTHHELIEWLDMALSNHSCNTVVFADAAAHASAAQDPAFRIALEQADLLLPRSRGVRASVDLVSSDDAPEIGVDALHSTLLMELALRNLKVYLLTESEEQVASIQSLLETCYPGLECVGALQPSQDESALADQFEAIGRAGADVVISALPSPEQERLLNRFQKQLQVSLAIGLGDQLLASQDSAEAAPAFARRLGIGAAWAGYKQFQQRVLFRPLRALTQLRYRLRQPVAGDEGERTGPRAKPINPVLTRSAFGSQWWRIWISLRANLWAFYCRSQRRLKRLMDILGSGFGLLCLSPLLLSVMALVKITSPGPIFYSQIRVGYRGQTFRMWKFRSMYIDADARKAALMAQNEVSGGVIFKMKKDPRITPVGRVIRRLSIDELPQLFNVFIGDMSLVGPRPALEAEVAQYPILARARLEAMPGLTGLWQISGRSDLPFDKQILLDTTYVHSQSAGYDLKLIAKTIPAVISGKGAY